MFYVCLINCFMHVPCMLCAKVLCVLCMFYVCLWDDHGVFVRELLGCCWSVVGMCLV